MRRFAGVSSLIITALVMVSCTSLPAADSEPAESVQSGTQSDHLPLEDTPFSLLPQSGGRGGAKQTRYPLVERQIETLPFDLWSPEEQELDTNVLTAQALAQQGVDFEASGDTRGEPSLAVLAMLESGVPFVRGQPLDHSTTTVGVLDEENQFLSLAETIDPEKVRFLPEASPFETLQAVSAGSAGPLVVWLSVGAGGKQWSLMGWNEESGVVQELASSASMTLSFSGVSATLVPGLEPPRTNAGYAYYEVSMPHSLFESATPGLRFQDLIDGDVDDGDAAVATFRVALDAPGVAEFVGPSAQVLPDPVDPHGLYWVTSPFSDWQGAGREDLTADEDEGNQDSEEGGDQNPRRFQGAPGDASWGQALSYSTLHAFATGHSFVEVERAPVFVVWGDEDSAEPLFGVGPADRWVVSDLAATEGFVVAVATGEEAAGEGLSSWLLVWDLEEESIVAAIPSPVPLPSVSASGDLVLWGGSSTENSADDSAAGETDTYVWQRGGDEVLALSSSRDGERPLIGGERMALTRTYRGGSPYWQFITWKQ